MGGSVSLVRGEGGAGRDWRCSGKGHFSELPVRPAPDLTKEDLFSSFLDLGCILTHKYLGALQHTFPGFVHFMKNVVSCKRNTLQHIPDLPISIFLRLSNL